VQAARGAAVTRFDQEHYAGGFVLFVLIAFVIVMLIFFARVSCAYRRECERRGGHTHALYKSTICIGADGRIVEW
jgi:hypothetical protein